MTDIAQKIKEIARIAAHKSLSYNESGRTIIINAAIYEAIEAVLTREPSDGANRTGMSVMRWTYSPREIYRAMTAALLEEIRKERK